MNDNVIIELKQTDGTKIQSGEFINNLSKPITIYDQDQIAISKVFIDTEAQTDALIDIPFDIEIETQQVLSITNDNLAKFAVPFSDGSNTLDNRQYFLYDKLPNGHPNQANMMHITRLIVSRADGRDSHIGDPDGSNAIAFSYVDVLDKNREVYISFPRKKSQNVFDFFDMNLFVKQLGDPQREQNKNLQIVQSPENIQRCKNCNFPTFIIANRGDDNAKIQIEGSTAGDGTFNKETIAPTIFQDRIVIEKGKYEAQDICDIITNNLSRNTHPFEFAIANNIQSQFLVNSANYTGADKSLVSNLTIGLNNMRSISANAGFFIGSNQVQLSYNTQTNKFFWNFLHFPIYNTSGVICSRIIETVNPNFSMQTKNGSVAFLKLSAVNNDTREPFDFWTAKLGFQLDKVCVTPEANLEFDDNATIFNAELVNVLDGINTTNAKVDLDSIVNKAGNDYNYQKVMSTAPFPFIQSNFNTVIEANEITVRQLEDITVPYFLVEMNAGFKTNLVSTETTNRSITGIIDRYYSKGSYTMGNDNSLIYTHRGQPLVLSKFYTRILQPDRTLPTTLGDDNTVFIEIIRNNEYFLMQRELEIQQEIQQQAEQEQSQNK